MEQKTYKYIFIALSLIISIVMLTVSSQYGQSGDEWLHIIYGQDIWDYFTKDSKQALDYTAKGLQYSHVELYGGFFEFITEGFHRLFPSIPILNLRHFFNASFGILLMIFTGLLAAKISKKWYVGIIALLFVVFSPKIFGESMNNPKDIPFAAGFVIGIYFIISFLIDFPNKYKTNLVGLGLGFGLTLAVRPAGGFLLLVFIGLFTAYYYLINRKNVQSYFNEDKKLLKNVFTGIIIAFLGGYILGILFWPYGLENPFTAPLESLKVMANFSVQLKTLFEGEMMYSQTPKWYYEFKWIGITSPIIVILSCILFFVFIKKAIKEYGKFNSIVLIFSFLFPLLFMIYNKSTLYDTWRHVLFVYPFIVVLAALLFNLLLTNLVKGKPYLLILIAFITLLPEIIFSFKNHPNQVVYFNQLVGGINGAFGNYETDYYQNSGKQAGEWMIKNLKGKKKGKIKVLTNMSGAGGCDKYFANDTNWIGVDYGRWRERDHTDWDYFIAYSRFISSEMLLNKKWPPANVVHTVEADGVPLCVVIERKNKEDIIAFDSLQKNNFAFAAEKYANNLKLDQSNENIWYFYAISLANIGKFQDAIMAINKAIEIDPNSTPEWYQIASKLYAQIGDNQNAQLNNNKAFDLANKLNENSSGE